MDSFPSILALNGALSCRALCPVSMLDSFTLLIQLDHQSLSDGNDS